MSCSYLELLFKLSIKKVTCPDLELFFELSVVVLRVLSDYVHQLFDGHFVDPGVFVRGADFGG